MASATREWHSEVYNCTDDLGLCLNGCCCAPCLFGDNAERGLNQNCIQNCALFSAAACLSPTFVYYALPALYTPSVGFYVPLVMIGVVGGRNRSKLREKYRLAEGPCPCGGITGDFCVYYWCAPCAICQEAREIKFIQKGGGAK